MWYSVDSRVDTNDYTIMDETNIKKLYDELLVEAEYPTYTEYKMVDAILPKKFEEDECENVM